MTAENIYLYLFLVGVFFTAGNLAISGISHVIGGLGGGAETDGADAIDIDGGHAGIDMHGGHAGIDIDVGHTGIGDSSGFDGMDGGVDAGADFGADFSADFSADVGVDIGVDTGMDVGVDVGIDVGADIGVDVGVDVGIDVGADTGADIGMDVGAGAHSGVHPGFHHDAHMGAHPVLQHDTHHADHSGAHPAARSGAGGFNLLSLLTTWLPIRPTALICFSTVTGGAGSIFLRLGWTDPLMHICSIASGYGMSMLLGVALPRRLRRAQNTSAAERYELVGLPAQVTSAILENGFGRISYTARDNTYSAPARHIEGKRVQQGARVVICEIKKNVFYVTELEI